MHYIDDMETDYGTDRQHWRVVIADDEKPGRDRVIELLQHEHDFELVAACDDGIDAIRAIEELSPDLALLDVQMPEITGLDVIDAVDPDDMPFVIFVTAYDE